MGGDGMGGKEVVELVGGVRGKRCRKLMIEEGWK